MRRGLLVNSLCFYTYRASNFYSSIDMKSKMEMRSNRKKSIPFNVSDLVGVSAYTQSLFMLFTACIALYAAIVSAAIAASAACLSVSACGIFYQFYYRLTLSSYNLYSTRAVEAATEPRSRSPPFPTW